MKSKRVTNLSGTVVSTIELDPWGGNTNRNTDAALQPQAFTTYTRDSIAADDAMFRRYNRWWSRFDQRDPYGGSYNLANPQSFNRYPYAQNDPVNLTDPLGLDPCTDENGRPIDCGPDVRPEDTITFRIYDYLFGPFYIPADISGGNDLMAVLIYRRRARAIPPLQPGPTIENVRRIQERQRMLNLADCRAEADRKYGEALMAGATDAIDPRTLDGIDLAAGTANNVTWEGALTKKALGAAAGNTATGVLLSREVRAYWNLVTNIGPQYGKDLEDCEKKFGKKD